MAWSGAWVGLVSSSPLQSLKAVKGQQRHEAAVHAQGLMRMQIELCVDKASRTYDSAFLPIAAAVEIIADQIEITSNLLPFLATAGMERGISHFVSERKEYKRLPHRKKDCHSPVISSRRVRVCLCVQCSVCACELV